MMLVGNWKDAWKWMSVNCMVIATAVQGAWIYIPDDMRSSIPPYIVHFLTMGLLVLGIVGRITKKSDPIDKETTCPISVE